jgi:hypothetical protein
VLVLFAGALISLVALMAVTTIYWLRSDEESVEDPFIQTLRTRYESEIQMIVRLGELKIETLNVLRELQGESIQTANASAGSPELIAKSSIIVRLRQQGIQENARVLENALSLLVDESKVWQENYGGPFWIVPNEHTIKECINCLNKYALVYSYKTKLNDNKDFMVEGFKFTALCRQLACDAKIPESVLGEYLLPKLLGLLRNDAYFANIVEGREYLFVNRQWQIGRGVWQQWLADGRAEAVKRFDKLEEEYQLRPGAEFIEQYMQGNVVGRLPRVIEKGGYSNWPRAQDIDTIVSILTDQLS